MSAPVVGARPLSPNVWDASSSGRIVCIAASGPAWQLAWACRSSARPRGHGADCATTPISGAGPAPSWPCASESLEKRTNCELRARSFSALCVDTFVLNVSDAQRSVRAGQRGPSERKRSASVYELAQGSSRLYDHNTSRSSGGEGCSSSCTRRDLTPLESESHSGRHEKSDREDERRFELMGVDVECGRGGPTGQNGGAS
jgi:hypothetical protein